MKYLLIKVIIFIGLTNKFTQKVESLQIVIFIHRSTTNEKFFCVQIKTVVEFNLKRFSEHNLFNFVQLFQMWTKFILHESSTMIFTLPIIATSFSPVEVGSFYSSTLTVLTFVNFVIKKFLYYLKWKRNYSFFFKLGT